MARPGGHRDSPMCRALGLDVDGVPTTFYVRGIGELTDADKEVLIACAREMAKRLPPDLGERQAERRADLRQRNAERFRRADGEDRPCPS